MDNITNLSIKQFSGKRIDTDNGQVVIPNMSFGDLNKNLLKLLVESFKNMRLLVFYTKDSYAKLQSSVKEILSYSYSPYVEFVINDITDIDNATIGEEYRGVIAVGEGCVLPAKKIASQKEIPIIVIPTEGDLTMAFSHYQLVKNKDGFTLFEYMPCNQHFIFDKKLCQAFNRESMANCMGYAIAYQLGIIDYSYGAFINDNKINKACAILLKESVNAFKRLDFGSNDWVSVYLEASVKLAIAQLIGQKDYVLFNSCIWCALVEGVNNVGVRAVGYIGKLLELYKVYFSDDIDDYYQVPDYNADMEKVAKITGVSKMALLTKNPLNAKEIYNLQQRFCCANHIYLMAIEKVQSDLVDNISRYERLFGITVETPENIDELIKCAPYVNDGYILLQSIRDAGLFE